MNLRLSPLLSAEALTVLLAAERGSLTATARDLRISQSAASRRIQALERALGVVLFDRLTRGVRLTPEGEALVAKLQEVRLLVSPSPIAVSVRG